MGRYPPVVDDEPANLRMLDLNMPHLHGFAVMARRRTEQGQGLCPILVPTARQARDYRLQALLGGARDAP